MEKLEQAISRFLGQSNSTHELAQVLALASSSGRISYEAVESIVQSDAEDVLILSNKWRLILPLRTLRTIDWENRILFPKPGEMFKVPEIVIYLSRNAMETGQWNVEQVISGVFRNIGDPDWNMVSELVSRMIHRAQNNRINAAEIREITDEMGIGKRTDPLIAELKGTGIISPTLSLFMEVLKARAPIYEINPSLFIKE